jgi:hypothetical protein
MFWTWLDRATKTTLKRLGKSFSLRPSQSRWGVMSILSTTSLGLLAIGISLGALYLATKPCGGNGMTSVLILAWILGGFGLLCGIVFVWWGLYFWRNPNKPSIEESFRRVNRSLTKISNNLDKIVEQKNTKRAKPARNKESRKT